MVLRVSLYTFYVNLSFKRTCVQEMIFKKRTNSNINLVNAFRNICPKLFRKFCKIHKTLVWLSVFGLIYMHAVGRPSKLFYRTWEHLGMAFSALWVFIAWDMSRGDAAAHFAKINKEKSFSQIAGASKYNVLAPASLVFVIFKLVFKVRDHSFSMFSDDFRGRRS